MRRELLTQARITNRYISDFLHRFEKLEKVEVVLASIALLFIVNDFIFASFIPSYNHQDAYDGFSSFKKTAAWIVVSVHGIRIANPIVERILDSVKIYATINGASLVPSLYLDGIAKIGIITARFVDNKRYEADLVTLAKLGQEAFGGYNSITFKERKALYQKWFQRNKRAFIIIERLGVPIGYLCILPMNERAHREGEVSQYNLERRYMSGTDRKSKLIYLQAIFVKWGYRKSQDVKSLLMDVLITVIARSSESLSTTLYAEEFTKEGRKVLHRLGFSTMGDSFDGKTIHELRLNGSRPKNADASNLDQYHEFTDKMQRCIQTS